MLNSDPPPSPCAPGEGTGGVGWGKRSYTFPKNYGLLWVLMTEKKTIFVKDLSTIQSFFLEPKEALIKISHQLWMGS